MTQSQCSSVRSEVKCLDQVVLSKTEVWSETETLIVCDQRAVSAWWFDQNP